MFSACTRKMKGAPIRIELTAKAPPVSLAAVWKKPVRLPASTSEAEIPVFRMSGRTRCCFTVFFIFEVFFRIVISLLCETTLGPYGRCNGVAILRGEIISQQTHESVWSESVGTSAWDWRQRPCCIRGWCITSRTVPTPVPANGHPGSRRVLRGQGGPAHGRRVETSRV